jgi:hypothetical protein
MQEFQMEILILEKFIINGRMYDRGIIQFLANGKHGQFIMDVKSQTAYIEDKNEKESNELAVANNNRSNTLNDRNFDSASVQSGNSATTNSAPNHHQQIQIESKKLDATSHAGTSKLQIETYKQSSTVTSDDSKSVLSLKKEKKSFFSLRPLKDKKQKNKNGDDQEGTANDFSNFVFFPNEEAENELDTTSHHANDDVDLRLVDSKSHKKVKAKVIKASDTQFDKLVFSAEAELLSEIQQEIEADINEFITCMKNSIFYGSGIQRFYNQELDKLRRKFIELEEGKRRWSFHVFNHINKKDSKVTIPAPKMSDEIASRSRMVKNLKEINALVSQFEF